MDMPEFICVKDYEDRAFSIVPKRILDFYRGGAGAEVTLRDNCRAFSRYKVRPSYLRNVSGRNLSTNILGSKVSMPIGVAPTSLHKMIHPDGEIATVKAAEKMGTIFTLSTASNSLIEDVAKAAPNCIKWFQLYVFKDRYVSQKLVQKAEDCGFKALVLTVDLPVIGIRPRDLRNKFFIPKEFKYANIEAITDSIHIDSFIKEMHDASLTWDDVLWLKSITKLPIILKGILTAEDALLAKKYQVAGIAVSNHGARQLDSCLASIDALEDIVKAVEGSGIEIYLDGGIRNGTDVFKALALGAKMVFVGRPPLWGLAVDGQRGVENVLKILKNEFENTLALSGCRCLGDIERTMVVHQCKY